MTQLQLVMLTLMTQLSAVMAKWDPNSFVKNAASYTKVVGGGIVILLGVLLVIWGVWKISEYFFSDGRKQVSIGKAIVMVFVGGAFMYGGWSLVSDFASGGYTTVKDFGKTGARVIDMLPYMSFML